jgi:hypothetical protein
MISGQSMTAVAQWQTLSEEPKADVVAGATGANPRGNRILLDEVASTRHLDETKRNENKKRTLLDAAVDIFS